MSFGFWQLHNSICPRCNAIQMSLDDSHSLCVAILVMDNIVDSSCSRNMDPEMALGSSEGLDATMVPEAAQATQINMAPVSTRPSDTNMVWGGCSDPEHLRHQLRFWMLMGHRPRHGSDGTMTLGGSAGHSDRHGPSDSTALGHWHGLRIQSKPHVCLWPLVVPWAMDINMDPVVGQQTQTWSLSSSWTQIPLWSQGDSLFLVLPSPIPLFLTNPSPLTVSLVPWVW